MKIWAREPAVWAASALALYVYGAAFAYLVSQSTPEQFQRFGTIGIVSGVVLFGLSASWFEKSGGSEKNSQREHAAKLFDFHSKEFRAGEVFLVALGTLQTGYGDLFHCLINGNGWTTC